jgi:hypothetical protein
MKRVHAICVKRAAILWAAFFALPLYADSEVVSDAISIVTVSGTTDSDDGSDYYLDANIALPEQRRLILSLGQLYIKSSETGREIQPYTVLLGLESDFDAKSPLGVEFEYWDDQENINVKTLRGALGYQFDKVHVLFKPQIREFNFTGARATRETSSEGFSINVGAEVLGDLYLYGEYGKHYYSQTVLDLAAILLSYDYVRLKLVSSIGFSDYLYTLGGSYYLTWGSLSGYWIQSVSAIDQTRTYSYGGTVEVDVLSNFSLGLSLGTQSYERDDPEFLYGTLLLSYYW